MSNFFFFCFNEFSHLFINVNQTDFENITTHAAFQMVQLQVELSWEKTFTFSDDSDKYFLILAE